MWHLTWTYLGKGSGFNSHKCFRPRYKGLKYIKIRKKSMQSRPPNWFLAEHLVLEKGIQRLSLSSGFIRCISAIDLQVPHPQVKCSVPSEKSSDIALMINL